MLIQRRGGQSPGKRLAGIRVVDEHGGDPSVGALIERTVPLLRTGAPRAPDSSPARGAQDTAEDLLAPALRDCAHRSSAWAAAIAARDGISFDRELLPGPNGRRNTVVVVSAVTAVRSR